MHLTHPLDMLAVNATFFIGGGVAIAGGGVAVAGECLEPTPAEPLTCGAVLTAGPPVIAAGGMRLYQGVTFFKDNTLPAIEEWGSHE